MHSFAVKLEGDGAWPDLSQEVLDDPAKAVDLTGPNAPAIEAAVFPRGTRQGHPTVILRFDLPDGRVLVIETTARLFVNAADIIRGRYAREL